VEDRENDVLNNQSLPPSQIEGESAEDSLTEKPVLTSTNKKRRWPSLKTVAVVVVVALVAGVAADANWRARTHTHTYSIADIFADGRLDQDYTMLNATADETYAITRQSVRIIVVGYADSQGQLVGVLNVPGIVVSEKYVLTTSQLLPSEGYQFAFAILLPAEEDRTEKPEELAGIAPLDKAFGMMAFIRPNAGTADAPKFSITPLSVSTPNDLYEGDALINLRSQLIPRQNALPLGLVVPDRSSIIFATRGAQFMLARGVNLGEPVFALRDGTPEFVGICVEVDNGTAVVATSAAINDYLDFLNLAK